MMDLYPLSSLVQGLKFEFLKGRIAEKSERTI